MPGSPVLLVCAMKVLTRKMEKESGPQFQESTTVSMYSISTNKLI